MVNFNKKPSQFGPFKSSNQLRKPIEIVLLNSSNDEASQFL